MVEEQESNKMVVKEIEDAFEFFTKEQHNVKVRGNEKLSLYLDALEKHGEEKGLSHSEIDSLMDVVISEKFPPVVCKRLVRLILPKSRVAIATVSKLLSFMCSSTNFPLMQLLMRWLVVVHACIDDRQALHAFYDVIFYFLQPDTICAHACELLYHVTRKQDVRLYRVQTLLQLQQRKGSEPHLLGLLSVYKLYCPHLVSVAVPTTRKSFFRGTDRGWAEKVRALQRRCQEEEAGGSGRGEEAESNIARKSIASPPVKRAKRSLPDVVPSLLSNNVTSQKQDGCAAQQTTLVPFAQIKSFKQLLKNLDSLELPGQLAAALGDRNLQHVLACYPDPSIALRLSYWLDHSLFQEFLVNGCVDTAYCSELLERLVQLTCFLDEALPVCEGFLSCLLQSWPGAPHRKSLLTLASYASLRSFSDLCDQLLDPIRKLFFTGDISLKCDILETVTSLLRNLVQVELPRYRQRAALRAQHSQSSIAQQPTAHGVFGSVAGLNAWPEDEDDFSAVDTVSELINLVDNMCCVGLQLENNHPLLSVAAMRFYNLTAGLCVDEDIPLLLVCSPALVYRLLFSYNPVALTQLFSLINSYRSSFVALQSWGESSHEDTVTEDWVASHKLMLQQVHVLNDYIMNICEAVVRSKAFISKDERAIFVDLDTSAVESGEGAEDTSLPWRRLAKSFAFYRHPALLGYAHAFLEQTQEKGTHLHPEQIKPHRAVFLKFLSGRGLAPLRSFIDTFIRTRDHSTVQAQGVV